MKKLFRLCSLVLALILACTMLLPTTSIIAASTTQQNTKIGTNFWFLASWSGEVPFKENVDWANAYANGDDIWNPTFIEELAPYKHLRFMDWGKTNHSEVVSWDQRRLPNDPTNQYASESEIYGLAYEWMIDLCNRTGKDLWICVPHPANDDYLKNLAKLIHEKMNDNIHCFIEYSNETWNPQFSQYDYCVKMANELGLPGSDAGYSAECYNLYRSLQIFDIFDEEFGEDVQNKVTKIVSISANPQWFFSGYYNIFLNSKYNPDWQKPDVLCMTAYVGGDHLKGSDPDLLTKFKQVVDETCAELKVTKEKAEELGLRMGTYEGGQHLLDGADIFSRSPIAYEAYTYLLDNFSQYYEFITHYAHCGTPASGGAWGAKHYTGEPIEDAHRYRALVDWTNKNPSTNEFIVSEIKAPAAPSPDSKYINDSKTKIIGTAESNLDIVLKIDSEIIQTVRSTVDGDFTFKGLDLKKYKKNTPIEIYAQYEKYGKVYQSKVKKFELIKLPKDVKVTTKKINKKTKKISGKTSPKAKVRIQLNNKIIKNVKADKKGNFTAKVNLSKAKKKSKIKVFAYVVYNKKIIKSKVYSKKL